MSGFTPGPWEWYNNLSGEKIGISDGEKDVLYVNHSESIVIPREKDAHLIAAAPDLYEALIAMSECLDNIISGNEWGAVEDYLDEARTALDKARGEL